MTPKEYTGDKIQLPAPEDVPNLDIEVINYHRPVLGTFHAKLCVIDRKIGLLQSNNVQDNDNLEMMVHLEGPIVDAMYDTLLISWHKPLSPPLPLIGRPAAKQGIPTYEYSASNPVLAETVASGSHQEELKILPESTSTEPHYDQTFVEEAKRVNSQLNPRPGESNRDAATRHLSMSNSLISLMRQLTRNEQTRELWRRINRRWQIKISTYLTDQKSQRRTR